jgi:hypothetical protein
MTIEQIETTVLAVQESADHHNEPSSLWRPVNFIKLKANTICRNR